MDRDRRKYGRENQAQALPDHAGSFKPGHQDEFCGGKMHFDQQFESAIREGEEPETSTPPQATPNFSASFGKLAEALAKATLSFKPVIKDASNPFYKSKYADLATYLDSTREALAKNGLSIVQMPGFSANGAVAVTTMLIHTSGEWLRSEIVMPCSKPDAQGVGSALTYGRRYAYAAMLSLGAEDDDANASLPSKNVQTKEELDAKLANQERIGQFQVGAIVEACKKTGKTEAGQAEYLEKLGIKQWEQLQKQDFQAALKWANLQKIEAPAKAKSEVDQRLIAKLFATAAERGIPRNDVQQFGHEHFKVASLKDLNKNQIEELIVWASQA